MLEHKVEEYNNSTKVVKELPVLPDYVWVCVKIFKKHMFRLNLVFVISLLMCKVVVPQNTQIAKNTE
jgi:hypothetical protein